MAVIGVCCFKWNTMELF